MSEDRETQLLRIAQAAALWRHIRRPEQCTPKGAWDIWLILTGRFWGKTRTGAEEVRDRVNTHRSHRIHLVARTAADARDTIVEGESGLMAVCQFDVDNLPVYEPSKRRITWPNGAIAILFSADEPDALRGPQCDFWWADELASWRYLQETWDNLLFGARLGTHVQGMITTTPRPIKLLQELLVTKGVMVTRGSSLANSRNVAPNALAALRTRYEGTRVGRQEMSGEILDDNPGALWNRANIEKYRVSSFPRLSYVYVGVDPAASSTEGSDETGIVVAGRDDQRPPHFYVIDDMSVAQATPNAWGKQVVAAYSKHRADLIVPEKNNGGEMVSNTIKVIDPKVPIEPVSASRGKRTRAEPVSALSEQGRLHMVGALPMLEDQLCEWDPTITDDSPDRMDAMVWAITKLMEQPEKTGGIDPRFLKRGTVKI